MGQISKYFQYVSYNSIDYTKRIINRCTFEINKYEFSAFPCPLSICEQIILIEDECKKEKVNKTYTIILIFIGEICNVSSIKSVQIQ